MLRPTLLVAGVVALGVALAYAHVARRLWSHRPASREGGLAMGAFVLWWGALAANLAVVAASYLLAGAGVLTLHLQLVDSLLQRLLLAVSMTGLMHYLLYVVTGRSLLPALGVFYGAYYVVTTWSVFEQDPVDVLVGRWRTDLVYANPGIPWMPLVSLVAIVLPPIVASLAYLRLAWAAPTRAQRARVVVVSSAILVWWVVAVLAGQRAFLTTDAFQLGHRLLSLAAALAVLVAFQPPSWAQRWLGLEPYQRAS